MFAAGAISELAVSAESAATLPAPQGPPRAGPARLSRRQAHRPLPPADTPAGFFLQRRVVAVRNLKPPPGRTWRRAPVVPDDTTPIMPPARRRPHADFMPAGAGQHVTRRPPKPDVQPTDPPPQRRAGHTSWAFVPPPGNHRRGRPVLNEIGGDLPVQRSRRQWAAVIPFRGRALRRRLPRPDAEPQVLPPARRWEGPARPPLIVAATRRRVPLFGETSPAFAPPCPYRPHNDDQPSEYRPAAVESSDGVAKRADESDSLPGRVDECQ